MTDAKNKSQSDDEPTTEKFENFKNALGKKGIEFDSDAIRKNGFFSSRSNLFSSDDTKQAETECEDHCRLAFGRISV